MERYVALAAVVLAPPQRAEQPATRSPLTATAVRTTHPPRLDGRSDDAVWQTAPTSSEFRQFEPRVDAEPRFRTEFQVAYDGDTAIAVFNLHVLPHLYVRIHAFLAGLAAAWMTLLVWRELERRGRPARR